MLCGLAGALSATAIVPLRVPTATGVKVMATTHEPPAGTEAPQPFVCAKSPLIVRLVSVSGAVPELATVTLCVPLATPMLWVPNTTLVEERVIWGDGPGGAGR